MRTHPSLLPWPSGFTSPSGLGRINYNRPHTYNKNTDDNAEQDQTDGVGIF
jgi:hypothetical protein